MKLLVLDTSTEWCSAALWLDGRILARRVLAEQRHSSLLLPMVDELLRESDIGLRQLDGIGYGGSWWLSSGFPPLRPFFRVSI